MVLTHVFSELLAGRKHTNTSSHSIAFLMIYYFANHKLPRKPLREKTQHLCKRNDPAALESQLVITPTPRQTLQSCSVCRMFLKQRMMRRTSRMLPTHLWCRRDTCRGTRTGWGRGAPPRCTAPGWRPWWGPLWHQNTHLAPNTAHDVIGWLL